MEMSVIAVLLGLSLASFLTAKIAKALDMSYNTKLLSYGDKRILSVEEIVAP
jgi:hypothetical protein